MAQIRCGIFKAFKKGDVRFEGKVTLEGRLDDTLQLRNHPRADPENDRAPAFEVFLVKPGRNPVAVGAGWLKNHEKVGDFLSLTIDSPRWPAALNLTAFPPDMSKGDHADSWTVVWSRPRAARAQDESFDELAEQRSA